MKRKPVKAKDEDIIDEELEPEEVNEKNSGD